MKRSLKRLRNICFCLVLLQFCTVLEAAEHGENKPNPDEVIKMLQEGNHRFYLGIPDYPHTTASRLELAGKENQGDYAYATVITCSDSRVPVELLFVNITVTGIHSGVI